MATARFGRVAAGRAHHRLISQEIGVHVHINLMELETPGSFQAV